MRLLALAFRWCSRIQDKVNQCRQTDTTNCCENWQQRIFAIREFTVVKFAFEFSSDEQKENRHQCIVNSMLDTQTADIHLPNT
jgi:hypothetical protein